MTDEILIIKNQQAMLTCIDKKIKDNTFVTQLSSYCFFFLGKLEEDEQRGQSVSLSDKVSLHKGDITILEVDAIVNAGKGPGSSLCSVYICLTQAWCPLNTDGQSCLRVNCKGLCWGSLPPAVETGYVLSLLSSLLCF